MIVRALIACFVVIAAMLSGCASNPRDAVSVNVEPKYDGIYRLNYSAAGSSLYYRFYPGGVVVSARSDAPAADILANLNIDNAKASRGTWSANNGELRVGVEEGTVTYDSSFDIRPDGRIALRGLPRTFEFIRTDDAGNAIVTR